MLYNEEGPKITLEESIAILKRRKLRIHIALYLILSLTVVVFVVDHKLIQDTLLCGDWQSDYDEAVKRGYHGFVRHKTFWLVMALITLLWLIVPACRLSRILVKKVEDT